MNFSEYARLLTGKVYLIPQTDHNRMDHINTMIMISSPSQDNRRSATIASFSRRCIANVQCKGRNIPNQRYVKL